MSGDDTKTEPGAPTGYKILRGSKVIAEVGCPMCPQRFCLCFSTAWTRAKKEALVGSGRITIESASGTVLAVTQRVPDEGSASFRGRVGPGRPPRAQADAVDDDGEERSE